MSNFTIYHNPRCQKSRQALKLLSENGITPEIVEYLKEVPTKADLNMVLSKMNKSPQDILRKGEQVYKEKFKGKEFTDAEWLDILVENPKLIERPIIIRGNKAVIGRPPENVLELIF